MMLRIGAVAGLAAVGLWAQASVEGTWQGTLDVGAAKLRLGLHVSKSPQGEFSSTLDSIDQGAMGIPVKVTTFSGDKLHLELPNLKATFDGALSADGKQIAGTFVQGVPLPLVFKRVEKVDTVNRPQNPKPPFPYDAVDVSYENKSGIKLAGTLTLPRGAGPFPAAVMITGSGPQDRDEALLGHKPFLVIADYLTRRGIAILRVDDRGVGGSTGKSTEETLDDMAGDVVTGVEFLKARKEIDGKHIGVIGHSEGGIVGPAAAVRSPDIAFVVMLAGTGVVGTEVLKLQGEAIIRASGGTEGAATDAAVDAQFKGVTSQEMRSFLFYDPAEALRKLKIPVLALNGSRDLQVPPQQNLPAIRAALAAAGNTDFTVTELPGLNHLFQKCKKCTVQEYSELEETFSPTALEIMGDWIVRHTRPN